MANDAEVGGGGGCHCTFFVCAFGRCACSTKNPCSKSSDATSTTNLKGLKAILAPKLSSCKSVMLCGGGGGGGGAFLHGANQCSYGAGWGTTFSGTLQGMLSLWHSVSAAAPSVHCGHHELLRPVTYVCAGRHPDSVPQLCGDGRCGPNRAGLCLGVHQCSLVQRLLLPVLQERRDGCG